MRTTKEPTDENSLKKETEMKFLLRENGRVYASPIFFSLWDSVDSLVKEVLSDGKEILQGYLPLKKGMEAVQKAGLPVSFKPFLVRLRYVKEKKGDRGTYYLSVKGEGTVSREEVEKEISEEIFYEFWPLTLGKRIEKKRLIKELSFEDEKNTRVKKWEFDVFKDRDLVVCEVELSSEKEMEKIQAPGKDVSTENKYKNYSLAGVSTSYSSSYSSYTTAKSSRVYGHSLQEQTPDVKEIPDGNSKPKDTISVGDCVELLPTIPSESVSMVFADPPFNLGKPYSKYSDRKGEEEYLRWCEKWIGELIRVTKPTGSIFIHHLPRWLLRIGHILEEKGAFFKHWIAWDAWTSPISKTLYPNHYGILWFTKTEDDFVFHKIRHPHPRCRVCGSLQKDFGGYISKIHPFGSSTSDVWTDIHRIRHKKRRDEHPCQLPVHLIERLILMVTEPGDVILDPFIGTGTTAVAAKRLGRHYMGMEIDDAYALISRRKAAEAEPSLVNGCYVSVYRNEIRTLRDEDWEKVKEAFEIPPLSGIERRAPKLTRKREKL